MAPSKVYWLAFHFRIGFLGSFWMKGCWMVSVFLVISLVSKFLAGAQWQIFLFAFFSSWHLPSLYAKPKNIRNWQLLVVKNKIEHTLPNKTNWRLKHCKDIESGWNLKCAEKIKIYPYYLPSTYLYIRPWPNIHTYRVDHQWFEKTDFSWKPAENPQLVSGLILVKLTR